MLVKMLKTINHVGVKEGEIYEAQRYWLDPNSKVSLLKRVSDGFDPECNVYFSEIEIIQK